MAEFEMSQVLDQLPIGVTCQDARGRIVYANQKATAIIGMQRPAEITHAQSSVIDQFYILDEDGRRLSAENLPSRLAQKTHTLQSAILRFKHVKGRSEHWSLVYAHPILDGNKKFLGIINTFQDITDIKRPQQVLELLNEISKQLLKVLDYKEQLIQFSSLMVPAVADFCEIDIFEKGELVPVGISHADSRKIELAKIIRAKSHFFTRKEGLRHMVQTNKVILYPKITKRQLLAGADNDVNKELLMKLDIRSAILAPLKARNRTLGILMLAQSESGRSFSRRDLPSIEAITQRVALLLDNSKLYFVASQEIQKQKRIMGDLIESDNTLNLALDVGNMGIWDYDIPKDSISWSDGLKPKYGLRRGNIKGSLKDFITHVIPKDRKRITRYIKKAIKNGSHFDEEFQIVRRDGQVRWMHKQGDVLLDERGKAVRMVGISVDVTEQRRQQDTLRMNEKKFRSIFEGSLETILVVDNSLKVIDINDSGLQLLGLSKSVIIGQPLTSFMDLDQRHAFMVDWKKLQKHLTLRGTFKITSGDNRRKNIYFSANAQFLPGETLFMLQDITKRIEQEKRNEHLLGVTSHELRTPAASIKVYVDLLKRQTKKYNQEKITSYLAKIDEKTDVLTDLINNLLDLARIDQEKMEFFYEIFDFDDFLEQVIADLQLTIRTHTISYTIKVRANIVTDKNRLRQVITNLIKNAVKYSPEAEEVFIRTEKRDGMVVIHVQDHGVGIPPKEIPNIFDLFYRVDVPTGKKMYGLGIGLYICKQIVERMGGKIWAESTVGRGSVFHVQIPMVPKKL